MLMLSLGWAGACLAAQRNLEILQSPAVQAARERVVLVHGLGRSNAAMWMLAARLERAGYAVHRVGYRSFNNTAPAMLADVAAQVQSCCASGARPVHFVGHSLGGLLIRAYLQSHRPPQLGRVVLMGTPNHGAALADRAKGVDWVRRWVPVVTALAQDAGGMAATLRTPDYPLGVIAGVSEGRNNEAYLPGADDGVVTVASTRLDGMADFVQVATGHTTMRYDSEVAHQVVTFLKQGRFEHHTVR